MIDAARWMHTGRTAVMREDGYIKSQSLGHQDIIIRGGETVSALEVEEFLRRHPKIVNVQVIGVPDEEFGEEILACVILNDRDGTLTQEEVAEFCKDRLANYKIPRYIRRVDSFPSSSGKLRKRVTLEELGCISAVPQPDP